MAILKKILCFLLLAVIVKSSPIYKTDPDLEEPPIILKIWAEEPNELSSDDVLHNKALCQGEIYQRRSKVDDETIQLWPDGVVVYKVDDKIGCPDSSQCEILMRAMDHYHTHSCIRFQEWTGEENYVLIFLNNVSSACWASIGRGVGEQLLSLGRRCWYQGIVVHELGHIVGFWHEMNRPDRDKYISINWANIVQGYAPAFEKQNTTSINDTFDFTSIMMYDEYAFSKDKDSPTISVKNNSVIGPLWRKPGLSIIDIQRIRNLYDCGNNRNDLGFPYGVNCSFNSHTCGFKNGGNDGWKWINSSEGYVYTSLQPLAAQKSEEEKTSFFVSVNFFGSNLNDTNSKIGCARFWYIVQGDGEVYLKLRQSYLTRTTQLIYLPQDTFDLWESENTTETWYFQQVPLYVTSPFKLIFETSFGNSTKGLVALDDFQLFFRPCPPENLNERIGLKI